MIERDKKIEDSVLGKERQNAVTQIAQERQKRLVNVAGTTSKGIEAGDQLKPSK